MQSTFLVPGSVPAAYGPSPPNPVPTPATGFPPGRWVYMIEEYLDMISDDRWF